MTILRQKYQWDRDFEASREFLKRIFEEEDSLLYWIPSRLENIKFGPCGTEYSDIDVAGLRIWEDDAKIVAMALPDSPTDYYIQTHPKYRFLEKEIVCWIEFYVRETKQKEDQTVKLNIYVLETDNDRRTLLTSMGYKNNGLWEYNRKLSHSLPISEYNLPDGFTIRNVRGLDDYLQVKQVLASVFPHCSNMTEKLFETYTKASFYNKELDLVVVAPDGRNFVAFCTIRMDPLSKIAEFEPVGTLPDYRRLGLGKALLCKGLALLRIYHPKMVCIGGAATTEAANRLYDSIGFTDKVAVDQWQKEI
ncbi:MAG: GNAT family N-acetyltransferase [Candidatus Thorarchaeota archaeon]